MKKKDQQYYLFELAQHQLEKILFPLSDYVKDEIRQIAIDNDLPPKSSKESQDICFIKKPMTTKKYLVEKIGVQQGHFVFCKTGEKMGGHEGFWQYTIGQRKGIGIAYTEPLYVVALDAKENIVYLGTKEDLLKDSLEFENLHFQYEILEKEFVANVKIRYNMQPEKGRVFIDNNKCGRIIFENPVASVTSGQAVVFYDIDDKHLVGGAWIK